MAFKYTRQALIILRTCVWPCRFENLAQSVPQDDWDPTTVDRIRRKGLDSLAAILNMELSAEGASQARIQLRHGGLPT